MKIHLTVLDQDHETQDLKGQFEIFHRNPDVKGVRYWIKIGGNQPPDEIAWDLLAPAVMVEPGQLEDVDASFKLELVPQGHQVAECRRLVKQELGSSQEKNLHIVKPT